MSSRTIRSSSPKSASARARASSVLPTPVGPRNRKLPIGRSGSPSPARERRTASATASTASSWPTTRSCRCCSRPQQPLRLLLGELADRDAGGPGHHLGDVLDADLGDARTLAAAVPGLLEPLLGLGDLVAQLRRPARTARRRPPGPCPAAAARARCSRPRRSVGGRLHPAAHPGPGLVDQVDRLVGQEPVGDVAVGQLHGRDERLVGEPHLVVGLVPVAQAAQDRDRVLDAGLGHQDRLEPAVQRGVLLDVAAVLVQRGRADDVQLAAGQRRLEHVAGAAGRPRAGAGPDDGVQLVEEDDELVAVLADLVDDLLQPLLEVAAVAGAGDQAGQVELDHPLAAQGLRHVALDDPLRRCPRRSRSCRRRPRR